MTQHSAYSDDQRQSAHPFVRSGAIYPAPGFVLATLQSEVGGGVYNWTRMVPTSGRKPSGVKSGKCTELNYKTGITTPRNVKVFSAGNKWWFEDNSPSSGGGGSGGWYGDASDGDVTFSGSSLTATYAASIPTQGISGGGPIGPYQFNSADPGYIYPYIYNLRNGCWYHFLGRDLFCHDLTIGSNTVVVTCGNKIHATGTVSGGGYISDDGDIARWGADNGGSPNVYGYFGTGAFGGLILTDFSDGQWALPGGLITPSPSATQNGAAGRANSHGTPPFDEISGLGPKYSGKGGNAGTGTGGSGTGTGWDITSTSNFGSPMMLHSIAAMALGLEWLPAQPTPQVITGGAGGGSGAAVGPGRGGVGGVGGGRVLIRAKAITGITITAKGGTGLRGDSGSGGKGGGGGGGNGGWVSVISDSVDPSVVFDVSKGSGGAGAGGASNGADGGTDGAIRKISPI